MITEPNTEGAGNHVDPEQSLNSPNAFVIVTDKENAVVSGVHFFEPFVNHPGAIDINGVVLERGRWNWSAEKQRWLRA